MAPGAGTVCWPNFATGKIDAIAVELPFTGFADDVGLVRSAIGSASQGVVVCAHSYGGAVVSQAVTQLTNVGHLVYLAAFVNSGDASALTDRPISLLEAIVPAEDECSFDPHYAHSIFYGDSRPRDDRRHYAPPSSHGSRRRRHRRNAICSTHDPLDLRRVLSRRSHPS